MLAITKFSFGKSYNLNRWSIDNQLHCDISMHFQTHACGTPPLIINVGHPTSNVISYINFNSVKLAEANILKSHSYTILHPYE